MIDMKRLFRIFKKKADPSELISRLEAVSALIDKWTADTAAFLENKDMSLTDPVNDDVFHLAESLNELSTLLPSHPAVKEVFDMLETAVREGMFEIASVKCGMIEEDVLSRLPIWPEKARARIDLLLKAFQKD